jgi:hypothetical protein
MVNAAGMNQNAAFGTNTKHNGQFFCRLVPNSR